MGRSGFRYVRHEMNLGHGELKTGRVPRHGRDQSLHWIWAQSSGQISSCSIWSSGRRPQDVAICGSCRSHGIRLSSATGAGGIRCSRLRAGHQVCCLTLRRTLFSFRRKDFDTLVAMIARISNMTFREDFDHPISRQGPPCSGNHLAIG